MLGDDDRDSEAPGESSGDDAIGVDEVRLDEIEAALPVQPIGEPTGDRPFEHFFVSKKSGAGRHENAQVKDVVPAVAAGRQNSAELRQRVEWKKGAVRREPVRLRSDRPTSSKRQSVAESTGPASGPLARRH